MIWVLVVYTLGMYNATDRSWEGASHDVGFFSTEKACRDFGTKTLNRTMEHKQFDCVKTDHFISDDGLDSRKVPEH